MEFKPVTDAELAILECLWESSSATKREMALAVYGSGSDSGQATVQKLLQRLEAKGYVSRDRSQTAHVFAATLSKAEFAGRQLEVVADRFSAGSFLPLVMHLVENQRLSKSERKRLRKLLENED